jgi:hypothetical protein
MRLGLRFIGVVKTATRQFPMGYLSQLELQQRGDRKGLMMRGVDGEPSLLAFVWMDRNRRYFIASGSSLNPGVPYNRFRWRQLDDTANADPERVELNVWQPKAAEVYYACCGKIDQHNRHRMDTLGMERKLGTTSWAMRVNMSVFGMIVVDAWLAYSQCTRAKEVQKSFYAALAEELIDNNYDSVGRAESRRNRGEIPVDNNSPTISRSTGVSRSGIYAHLTPTKKRRKRRDGVETKYTLQGQCRQCREKKSTHICSQCLDETPGQEPWICYTKNNSMCFSKHMAECHGI